MKRKKRGHNKAGRHNHNRCASPRSCYANAVLLLVPLRPCVTYLNAHKVIAEHISKMPTTNDS